MIIGTVVFFVTFFGLCKGWQVLSAHMDVLQRASDCAAVRLRLDQGRAIGGHSHIGDN